MGTVQQTRHWVWVALAGIVLSGQGCRTSVHRVEMERVDQSPGGNHGFLKGTAPASVKHEGTREIAELQVELPTTVHPAARSTASWPAATTTTSAPALEASAETYTVKQGDTLWKIAHKFYGKGTLWLRIYEANRDQLSEPGRLRAGMRLRIPRDGQPAETSAPSEK